DGAPHVAAVALAAATGPEPLGGRVVVAAAGKHAADGRVRQRAVRKVLRSACVEHGALLVSGTGRRRAMLGAGRNRREMAMGVVQGVTLGVALLGAALGVINTFW